DNDGPFASPLTTVAEAEHVMRHRRLGALPVVDEHGNALGVVALSR
ncbi:CBS domain-containing protein, partial [Streptomyces viridosporus]